MFYYSPSEQDYIEIKELIRRLRGKKEKLKDLIAYIEEYKLLAWQALHELEKKR